jgi:RecA-family ATPase
MHIIAHSIKDLLKHVRNAGKQSIIGDGFLERGCAVMLVGASGSGKSKGAQAMAAALATGTTFAGIEPNGEFKVLYLQSEDTEDDLAESVRGYVAHDLGNDPDVVDVLDENLKILTVVGADGAEFLRHVDTLCENHAPDVLVIDPLIAFIGCDLVDQKAVTQFLRKQLKPILMKHKCGCIAVHHARKDKGGPAIDQAIGAMEFAAFFRGMIHLGVREDRYREVTLKVVKRQTKLGWKDGLGNSTDAKYLLKGEDGVYFTEVSGFEPGDSPVAGGRPPKANKKEVAAFVLASRSTEPDEKKLVSMVADKFGYSTKQATRLVRAETQTV